MSLPFVRSSPDIRIFIACDNMVYFGFLEPFFNKTNITVADRCNTAKQAIELCDPLDVDLVIMDLDFVPDLLPVLYSKRPLLKVIGVTKDFEKPVIILMRGLKMRGYIYMNPVNKERVIECITAVARGELYFRFS